jgi:hypothetical protein
MAKSNPRIEAARKAYRDALEAARGSPSAEAWTRLLAAGKELSAAEEPPPRSRRRRPAPRPEDVLKADQAPPVEMEQGADVLNE